jgi:hydrogenase expression/formation protein HypE
MTNDYGRMVSDHILLAHGSGGRLTRELIEKEIVSRFGGGPLAGLPDAAELPPIAGAVLFTTDSFVVQPLEFPGGNIGHLAVHGTVNDLAVAGATPKWLSVGLILEEGLSLDLLRRILDTIRVAADEAGVQVVTGDTKVVGRGQCDGMYINTAGIGEKLAGFDLRPQRVVAGDRILVSGTLGDHGMAVLAARKGIDLENGPLSDTGTVHRLVATAHKWAGDVHFMRDPTRGGLSSVLNEVVEHLPVTAELHEAKLPFSSGTGAVSDLLGLDPLHMASEGRVVLFCAAGAADSILSAWQDMPEGQGAACIAEVVSGAGRVTLETITGGRRLVDVPRGELLPRIC